MEKARIAVLVSGGGTNLQALLDSENPYGEILLVVSDKPGAFALERAQKAGVRALCIPKKGVPQAEFERELLAVLADAGIELIVLAGFLCILSEDFTKRYPERILNIHPSLIPSFCGAGFYGLKVHEAALARGVKVTGATVHFVNEIPDGGKIVLQKAVEIHEEDTPESLQQRVMREAEWLLLPAAVRMVSESIVKGRKQ